MLLLMACICWPSSDHRLLCRTEVHLNLGIVREHDIFSTREIVRVERPSGRHHSNRSAEHSRAGGDGNHPSEQPEAIAGGRSVSNLASSSVSAEVARSPRLRGTSKP